MSRHLKTAAKWIAICALGFAAWWWSKDQTFSTLATAALVVLSLRMNYIEGTLKDRIEALEYRLDQHAEKLNRY